MQYLQVRSRRNCLTDPKKKPVFKFFDSTPRVRAAAKSAMAYTAQVRLTSTIAKHTSNTKLTHLFLPFFQLKTARAIVKEMDNNNSSELKKAAARDAAETAKDTRTSGFAPRTRAASTPKLSLIHI